MVSLISVEPAYLDKSAAAAFMSLSESTFEQLVRNGVAPKPRALSGRRVGWLLRELRAWAETMPVSEMLPPANTGTRKINHKLN
jgi:prophage regulatory protein